MAKITADNIISGGGGVVENIGKAVKQPGFLDRADATINNLKDLMKLAVQLKGGGAGSQVIETEAVAPAGNNQEIKALAQGKADKVIVKQQPPASLQSVAQEIYQLLNAAGLADKPIGELLEMAKPFSVNQVLKAGKK
ncbi:hypothetical protein ACFLYS_01720 [Chloroflexota bacterium]